MPMKIISEVFNCKQVETVYELAVMIYLADWADKKTRQVCCAHSQIAKATRMTERGVIQVLKKLQLKGVVQVITRGGGRESNVYTILPIWSNELGSPLTLWKTAKKANRGVNGVHPLPRSQEEKNAHAREDEEDSKKDQDKYEKGLAFWTPGSSAWTEAINWHKANSGDTTTVASAQLEAYVELCPRDQLPCNG